MNKAMTTLYGKLESNLSGQKHYSKDDILGLIKRLAEKPKRAKTAYQFFMGDTEVRTTIKDENPDAAPKEILSLMAGKWKSMEDDEKTKYVEMSTQDKKEVGETKTTKTRTRAKTAYQFFMGDAEVRAIIKEENPEAGPKDIMGLMGGKWKSMEDEEKNKYVEMST